MKRAALIALAAFGLGACLPEVQSVKERREGFDRDALRGDLILDELPSDAKPIGAVFGGRVELVGYRMEPEKPTNGGWVDITYYWKALTPMAEEFQIFIHGDSVGDKQSRVHGDHFPAEGRYPTDVWQVGEIVADPFRIFIPPGYGGKHLGIFTGMYKDDYRMPLTNAGVRPKTSDNRSRAIDIFF